MVFGLFSKEKTLQKTIDKATNKLAQQPDRWAALERLKEDGSEDALLGLCKRWSITSHKGVEDEQEKSWVVDTLVAKGPVVLPALIRYMASAQQLSFPLGVLERVADHDKVIEVADELFKSEKPGYARFPDRRIDLLKWFTEWKGATDDEILARVVPYLVDFDENVRFTAIEGLARVAPDKIVDPLVDALIRPEEESGRIRRTIVEVLARTQAPLGGRAGEVGNMLSGPLDTYRVDGGIVRER